MHPGGEVQRRAPLERQGGLYLVPPFRPSPGDVRAAHPAQFFISSTWSADGEAAEGSSKGPGAGFSALVATIDTSMAGTARERYS